MPISLIYSKSSDTNIGMKNNLQAASGKKRTFSAHTVLLSGYQVVLTRKKIKHIHLRICPPDGELRLSAPLHISLETIEKFITYKLPWIEKAVDTMQTRKQIAIPNYKDGELHYFLGQPYTLKITEFAGANGIKLHNDFVMEVLTIKTASFEQVEKILFTWYRNELRRLIPDLLTKWEPLVGVYALEWRIKRMKTRWGSCNPAKKRIWLSLELIKRPAACLEYILVHELTHLLEPSHKPHFYSLLTSFMPDWHEADTLLKEFGHKINTRDMQPDIRNRA